MERVLSDAKLASISDLSVGDWFLTPKGEAYDVGLVFNRSSNDVYCVEIGAEKAMCRKVDTTRERPLVLRLSVPESLCLKVEDSHRPNTRMPTEGQLVFSPDLGACIAIDWPGKREDEQYSNLLSLQGYQLGLMTDPAFVFERWAFGYNEPGGIWVDVVRR